MQYKSAIFEFTSYQFDPVKNPPSPKASGEQRRVVFNYDTHGVADPLSGLKQNITWTETIILPNAPDLKHIPRALLEKLLQSLHIILGISYWKFYCPPKIKLPYKLSKKEADFWNVVYKKGLGEFFYKNNLDPKKSPKFPYNSKIHYNITTLQHYNNKCLVGIGGGKDSIVSAELLKEHGADITAFVVETKKTELVENIIDALGVGGLKIQRILDEKVHQKHQYNGHIPISAIYAFLGIFSCALYKYSGFIASNERSSNFGSVKYKGLDINHQWSKSFEFEKLFSDYVKTFISPDLKYFSLMRPFYEIRIAKMFSGYKKYFPIFSSCNSNFKNQSYGSDRRTAENLRVIPRPIVVQSASASFRELWCNKCPKCVFTFTILSAFLGKKDLLDIFGENLYEKENLLSLFKDILGWGGRKPLDCVGTFKEAQTAINLAKPKFANSFIMRQFGARAKLSPDVFGANKQTSIPTEFAFLGMENTLILGYGKEGKITKQYLKKQYPELKIGVGDEALDKKYLEKQENFDIAVRTPGIKKESVKIPYTTATNIFFSKLKNKNIIIGVTGSKGKSTTASLIYEILKTAGRRVELLGNIGKPMLEMLLKPVPKDTIFVLELSSYQLDDIKYSPNISVVTSLFPEHMDYHGSLENYYNAKRNIINFQNKENYFVYDRRSSIMRQWAKKSSGKAVPFAKNNFKSNLLGEHNEKNIQAAVAVAHILKIKESDIKKAVKNFKGLPHRLKLVGKFKGITFYDDAISTTPESTVMAIKALGKVDTIFLGGQDRGYDFSQLEKAIKKYRIRNAVLFPDSGRKIKLKNLNTLHAKKMSDAVKFAYKYTRKGKICLLSCASPSYSLWKNFEEKGEEFQKFVKKFSYK